jgi:hypothetical protein
MAQMELQTLVQAAVLLEMAHRQRMLHQVVQAL